MKPALQIAELIQMPTFGINKVRKIALENLAQSVVLGYDVIRGGRVLRVKVARPHPADETKALTQFVELPVDKTVEGLETFITKVNDAHYLNHGEIKSDEFKEDFLPFYIDQLTKKLSYGIEPILERVNQGRRGVSTIYFSTVKEGKRVPHSARWTLLDFETNYDNIVVVPRKSYSTYREFISVLSALIGIERERIILRDDPETAQGETIDVWISPNDLVYQGKFQVRIPHLGDEPKLYSKTTGVPITPEEETDPENPGTGGESNPPSSGGSNGSEGNDSGNLIGQDGENIQDQEGNPIQEQGE